MCSADCDGPYRWVWVSGSVGSSSGPGDSRLGSHQPRSVHVGSFFFFHEGNLRMGAIGWLQSSTTTTNNNNSALENKQVQTPVTNISTSSNPPLPPEKLKGALAQSPELQAGPTAVHHGASLQDKVCVKEFSGPVRRSWSAFPPRLDTRRI